MLFAKGFKRKKKGLDYFDTYAHVARIATIITLIALASIYNFDIHQMDVKIAFKMVSLKKKFICINLRVSFCLIKNVKFVN
jgi:hypothetical protein